MRHMLHHARTYKPDIVGGRWAIETRRGRKDWEVIVEPDYEQKLLVVVTAYPVEEEA